MTKANAIVNSVQKMLDDVFHANFLAVVSGNGDIVVQVPSKFANRVHAMMELDFCESLMLVRKIKADSETYLVYQC